MPWATEAEEAGVTARGVRVDFEEEKEEEEKKKQEATERKEAGFASQGIQGSGL